MRTALSSDLIVVGCTGQWSARSTPAALFLHSRTAAEPAPPPPAQDIHHALSWKTVSGKRTDTAPTVA